MVGIALLRREQKVESEDERLLKLFQNRIELKKEFAKLRLEGQRLEEQLQQQENVMLRSQQQLEELEGMLVDPLRAANASIFYQLRGVWNHCQRKLTRLAEELLTHQRNHEMKLALDQFKVSNKDILAVIEQHEQQACRQEHAAGKELELLKRQYMQSRGFWNYFKSKVIAKQIESADEVHREAMRILKQCREKKRDKASEPSPVFEELSIEGRRIINLMLIAIAQELYLHFSKHDVSSLAREASVREVSDVNYGDANVCRDMNIHIDDCVRSLPSGKNFVARARNRIVYLQRCAGYRQETDTIPVAGSFAEIPLVVNDGGDVQGQRSVNINVLADEYWEVYSILLT